MVSKREPGRALSDYGRLFNHAPWHVVRHGLSRGRAYINRRLRGEKVFSPPDAILASYPKSGRTWLRFILANYFASISGRSPVDMGTMFAFVPNLDTDPVRGMPAYEENPAMGAFPLIAASHKQQVAAGMSSASTIFMVRDPRDVMVSAYFHATRQKHRFSGDIDAFLRDPEQGLPSWCEYLNRWADHLDGSEHQIVSYETLTAEPEQTVSDLLGSIGHRAEREKLRKAIELSRFDRMAALEIETGIPGHHYDRGDVEARRMRKGKVGGFEDYLSQDQLGFIRAHCEANLTPQARQIVDVTGWRAR